MRSTVLLAIFGMAVGIIACSEADPYGDLGDMGAKKTDKTESAATCSAGMAGADPESLKACTGTKTGSKGRCVPKSTLGSFSDTFEAAGCSGDSACVPEQLVKEGTKIELKDCTAVLNSPGKCFWPLAAQVIENYDLLKSATKGQCEGDQICAPCTDPRTQAETGVCSLGGDSGGGDCKGGDAKPAPAAKPAAAQCPQVDPILDESAFKQDSCASNMLCVDVGLVGADKASLLAKCATGVCAPKKSVLRGGNYVPKTCKSLAGAEGRCSNIGVPQIAEQKDVLPQADCDADERCAPCFDPTSGKETGACSQASCDKPKEKAVTFAECCGGGGKCVPTSAVGGNADSLNVDTCTGDTPVCAPKAFLPGGTPKKCGAILGIVKGVCASACSINKNGLVKRLIESDDCADSEVCVPCDSAPPGTAGCN
jgi:hypothetical protein